MKIFNIIFIVLFTLSAILQYNDPDPYLWIPIYLYAAFICFQAFHKKMIPILYIVGLLFYVSYALFLFVDDDGVLSWWREHQAENIGRSMKATKPWIEAAREFFGLLILIIALIMNWIWLHKISVKDRKDTKHLATNS